MTDPLRAPPEVVASWPEPNYINPDNRGPGLVYCAIILASFGVLIVVARVYSRMFITKAPGIDDLLIVFALLPGVALTVLVIIGNLRYHSGYHIWDIHPETASGHRLNVWISQWCYLTSTTIIKISVLLFYRRLSVSFTRAFWWATWVGIVYNVLQLVAFWIALLALCRPVKAYWLSFDRTWALENQGRYYCSGEAISLTLSAVVSILGDFYAATLPSLLIMRLNMSRKQELAVGTLFAVGYIVVGLGIGRAITLNRLIMHDYDYTWTLWSMWIWSLCELWIGLLAASAPALKPFCKRFLVEPLGSAFRTIRISPGHRQGAGNTNPAESTRRPARSWNFLSPPLPQQHGVRSPTKGIDDSSSSFVKHADETTPPELEDAADSAPGDLEQGSVPMRSWNSSIDSRMKQDIDEYSATPRCWSPASPTSTASAPLQMQQRQQQRRIARFSAPGPYTSDGASTAGKRGHGVGVGIDSANHAVSHRSHHSRPRGVDERCSVERLVNATPRVLPPAPPTSPTTQGGERANMEHQGIAIPMPRPPRRQPPPLQRLGPARSQGSADPLLSPTTPTTKTPITPTTPTSAGQEAIHGNSHSRAATNRAGDPNTTAATFTTSALDTPAMWRRNSIESAVPPPSVLPCPPSP